MMLTQLLSFLYTTFILFIHNYHPFYLRLYPISPSTPSSPTLLMIGNANYGHLVSSVSPAICPETLYTLSHTFYILLTFIFLPLHFIPVLRVNLRLYSLYFPLFRSLFYFFPVELHFISFSLVGV